MDLKATAEILFRKKWLIVFSVMLTVLLTAGATRLTGARWTGTVKFLNPIVSPLAEAPQEHNGGAVLDARAQSMMYASIVKSIDVVRPALAQLSFADSATDILDRIDFDASGERMYDLKISDTNPRRAEMLANSIADSFVRRNQELSTQQARNIVRLLEDQLRQADANIIRVRARYDAYSAQHRVLGDPNSQLYLVLKRMEAARIGRSDEEAHIAQLRSHRQAQGAALSRMPAQVTRETKTEPSALLKSLDGELAQIELNLLELRQQYTETNPKVAALLERRQQLMARRKEEAPAEAVTSVANPARATLADTVDEMDREIASSEATLATEKASIAAAEAELKKLRDVNSPLSTLGAELTSATEARTNLAARLNSARLALDSVSQQHSLVIVEHVGVTNPPVNMTAGRSKKMVMLAGLCALMAACALVIGLDGLDQRVKTVAQIERQLPIRVVAAIPRPANEVPPASLARATEMLPLSPHAEAYRFLGQSVLQAGGDVRSLMVVAAKSRQGNTNTIVNLSITLAQSGKRVLLVDANVRSPRLHTIFGLSNVAGLTDVLQSPTPAAVQCAIQPTSVPNLNVLTSGPASRNPWKLFSSQRLGELARRLQSHADVILYDTPSAVAFTDAMNLASVVDGALLCVRTLEVLNGEETRLLEQMRQASVTVLGCVMTDVPAAVMENFREYQKAGPNAELMLPDAETSETFIPTFEPQEFGSDRYVPEEFVSEPFIPDTFVREPVIAEPIVAKPVVAKPVVTEANVPKAIIPEATIPETIVAALQENALIIPSVPAMQGTQESRSMTPPSDQNSMNPNIAANLAQDNVNLPPPPVFTRAFNGYTVPAVDAYVQRIMHIIADLQRHIDQQSLKVQDLSGQLTEQRAHVEQLEVSLAQSAGDAGRVRQLTAQLTASNLRAEQFAEELKAARLQMDAMLQKEADSRTALQETEKLRAQLLLEQEAAKADRAQLEQAQAEIAHNRAQYQAEADALLATARQEAQTIVVEAERSRQESNRVQEAAQDTRQEHEDALLQARAEARAQMAQMLTILKNEAGTLLAESRTAAFSEAEQKYRRMQEQLEQEQEAAQAERARLEQQQAQAEAEIARTRAQSQAEADALLDSARQEAQAIAVEAERSRQEAAQKLAELYAAQEDRLKALGTECNAAIVGLRQMLEAQLALTSLPPSPSNAPFTLKSPSETPRDERIEEVEKRDNNGAFHAMWQ